MGGGSRCNAVIRFKRQGAGTGGVPHGAHLLKRLVAFMKVIEKRMESFEREEEELEMVSNSGGGSHGLLPLAELHGAEKTFRHQIILKSHFPTRQLPVPVSLYKS